MTTGCDPDSEVCRKTLLFIMLKKETNGHHLTALEDFPFSSGKREKAKLRALFVAWEVKTSHLTR